MGTSLFNTTPAATYPALIKVGDNTSIDGTLKTLSDGAGNDLPIQVSSTVTNFTGNVGIGTTNPFALLTVGGQSSFFSVQSAGTGSDFFYSDINPNLTAGANNQVVSLLRLRDRGALSTGGFTGTQRLSLIMENVAGGQFPFQLFSETGALRIGHSSVATPTALVDLRGSGSTSATTSLLVQNSLGTSALQVRDDGTTTIASNTNRGYNLDVNGTGIINDCYFGDSLGPRIRASGGSGLISCVYSTLTLSGNNSVGINNNTFNVGPAGSTNGQLTITTPAKVPNTSETVNISAGNMYYGGGEGRFVIQAQGNASGYNALGNMYIAGGRNTNGGAHGNVYLGVDLTGALGNVGVGLTAPTARLQVQGSGSTSATTSLLVQNSAGSAVLTTKDDLSLVVNDWSNQKITFTSIDSQYSQIDFGNTLDTRRAFIRGGRNAQYLFIGFPDFPNIGTSFTPTLVSIGRSKDAPTPLRVNGTPAFSITDEAIVQVNGALNTTNSGAKLAFLCGDDNSDSPVDSGGILMLKTNTFGSGTNTRMLFYNRQNTTLVERMRISDSGNLLVGTTTDIPSAKFVVDSTTQGFLPPRMTTAERVAIASPANGLIVFDTDVQNLCYRRDSTWVQVSFTAV
jgi:hypothetical protein